MKILILSDYAFVKGGAERVAISSAIGLSGKGHEVVFFSAVGPVSDELAKAEIKKIICMEQKDILDNPKKLGAMFSGVYNCSAIKSLKNLFSVWIPDIVHVHGVSKALSWAPINLFYSLKIPVIYTLHDYGLICPNLGIYNFKKGQVCEYYKPGCGWKCFAENCDKRNYTQKLWRWYRYFIVNNIYRTRKKISGFIAVSRFIEDLARQFLPWDKPLRMIYNPVGINESIPGECDKADNPENIQFLYVGRLSQEKGIDLLLSVMNEVNANLVIIGDGELMGMCRQYSEKLGRGKIRILGYISDRKRIWTEMRKSAALVLPSRCMEPAPLVITEAAMNCTPSIVANHGGLTEFVRDSINGFYFEAGSRSSLIASMEKIIKTPSFARELGKEAKKMIKEKNLDITNHIDLIEKYYIEILGM